MHTEPLAAPQGSTEMLESEYHRMAQVEAALWWYRSLHADLLDTIRKHFGADTNIRIADAGCGTGGFLDHLRRNGYTNCSGLDISTLAVDFCRNRGLSVQQGSIADAAALAQLGKADVIVSMDVICSLPDADQRSAFLRAAYQQLNPGGLMIVQTPAFECLGGIHDLAVGVNKRYTKRELRDLLRAAGIGSYRLRYRLMLLTPLVFVARAWQRMRLWRQKSGGNVKIESDVSLPPRVVNKLLYGLQRFEDRLLPLRPFGTS
ncbi:MAG: class I SAM-dependent methyltransferase, partial [Pseudomonadota bacterium]|nr:class I SAM-dependent methyltransferase [Pseudomonadota bacterium]